MKKKIRRLVIGIVGLVVLALVLGVVYIDHVAKAGIEHGSTYALGVPTKVNSTDIGIVQGHSELAGLNISNPQGFKTDHFLKLGNGVLDVSLTSLTSNLIEIPKLALSDIDVNLEKQSGKANYQVILDNLGRFESGKKEEPPPDKEGRKFIIREILISNVNVHVSLLPLAGLGDAVNVTVPIKELRLKDVGTDSDKGVLLAQLADTLVKAILAAAIETGGGIIPADMLNELQGGLKSLESLASVGASLAVEVEGQLKAVTAAGADVVKQVTGTVQQAVDQLKAAGDSAKATVDQAAQSAT